MPKLELGARHAPSAEDTGDKNRRPKLEVHLFPSLTEISHFKTCHSVAATEAKCINALKTAHLFKLCTDSSTVTASLINTAARLLIFGSLSLFYWLFSKVRLLMFLRPCY